jgi:hypothetical protein
MDNLTLVTIISGLGAIGGVLALDYVIAKSTDGLTKAVEQRPDIKAYDNEHDEIFKTEIPQIMPTFGPFTYFARQRYCNMTK